VTKVPVVIEFFGLPGAGKTTLSRRLTQLLRNEGVKVNHPNDDMISLKEGMRRKIHKLPYIIKEPLFHPVQSLRAALAINGSCQRSVADFSKVLVNWWYVTAILRSPKTRMHFSVLDQGVFQALWSIVLTGKTLDSFNHFGDLLLKSSFLPQIVVLVEARIPTLLERLIQREGSNSRLEKVSLMEQKQLVLRGLILCRQIVKEILPLLVSKQPIALVRVYNECKEDIEKSATLLLDYLCKSTPFNFQYSL
jgi:GTPase SAR1 family protein